MNRTHVVGERKGLSGSYDHAPRDRRPAGGALRRNAPVGNTGALPTGIVTGGLRIP